MVCCVETNGIRINTKNEFIIYLVNYYIKGVIFLSDLEVITLLVIYSLLPLFKSFMGKIYQ